MEIESDCKARDTVLAQKMSFWYIVFTNRENRNFHEIETTKSTKIGFHTVPWEPFSLEGQPLTLLKKRLKMRSFRESTFLPLKSCFSLVKIPVISVGFKHVSKPWCDLLKIAKSNSFW